MRDGVGCCPGACGVLITGVEADWATACIGIIVIAKVSEQAGTNLFTIESPIYSGWVRTGRGTFFAQLRSYTGCAARSSMIMPEKP